MNYEIDELSGIFYRLMSKNKKAVYSSRLNQTEKNKPLSMSNYYNRKKLGEMIYLTMWDTMISPIADVLIALLLSTAISLVR